MALPKEALNLARGLREKFRDQREVYDQADYRAELFDVLIKFKKDAYEGFVDRVADQIDEQSKSRAHDSCQAELFDLDGDYHLGGGKRVAKRFARIEHADTMLALNDRNLAAVLNANAITREAITKLRPYWTRGRNREQALEAYLKDNPEEEIGPQEESA